MKQKDTSYRFAERCLYDYKKNLRHIEAVKEEINLLKISPDVHAQNYEAMLGKAPSPSNPVEGRMVKIESLERLVKQLERQTVPVTRLMEDLGSPDVLDGSPKNILMKILRYFYFAKNQPELVIKTIKLGDRQFRRRRRELVCMAVTYLGL